MTLHDEALREAQDWAQRLVEGLSAAVYGKTDLLRKLAVGVLAGGHVLFEDVPGVGKTTAAKALARLITRPEGPLEFRRVQFTPDLLPYDITGVDVFRPETGSFEFKPGPVFSQILLGDEINRATPKVQSALLEVMEEGHVTIGGVTRTVDPFFLVIATQNPVDMDGTYPLPAAQLDRFFLRLSMGYPESESEKKVWVADPAHYRIPELEPVCTTDEILGLRSLIPQVHISPELLDLLDRIIRHTRGHASVSLGLSPRSGVHLVKALRAWALIHGRAFVTGQDIRDLAADVLSHRMAFRDERHKPAAFLETLLQEEFRDHEK